MHQKVIIGYITVGLHDLRRSGQNVDSLGTLVKELGRSWRILCLDEFQVVDVADAMLLRRLLEGLFDQGMHLLLTSNRHPTDLYANGLQRASFLPCIDLLQEKMEIVNLSGGQDYRQDQQRKNIDEIHSIEWPIDQRTSQRMDQVYERLCKGQTPVEMTIFTLGRPIKIKSGISDSIARFTFQELCQEPLSAADYLAIARAFPILLITEIPILTREHRDEARRFITLIDILYDMQIKLVLQMAAPPREIFRLDRSKADTSLRGYTDPGDYKNDANKLIKNSEEANRLLADELTISNEELNKSSMVTGAEEAFATHRTISRLSQMQQMNWWATASDEYHRIFEQGRDR